MPIKKYISELIFWRVKLHDHTDGIREVDLNGENDK